MVVVIKAKESRCELCNDFSELRPYGPNNKWICFKCGMKNEEATRKKYEEFLEQGLIIDTEMETEH